MNKTSAQEWLIKAYHDLKSAQILYEAEHFTDSIGVDLAHSNSHNYLINPYLFIRMGYKKELKKELKKGEKRAFKKDQKRQRLLLQKL